MSMDKTQQIDIISYTTYINASAPLQTSAGNTVDAKLVIFSFSFLQELMVLLCLIFRVYCHKICNTTKKKQ
jgi:hypothetical protein